MTRTNWDGLVGEYANRGFPERDWNFGYQHVLRFLGNVNGKRILDYGCGTGKFSRILAEKCAEVVGVDSNERMLDLAGEQECQGIRYEKATSGISGLGFFDKAVMNYVICGIGNDDEVREVLKQIYGSLYIQGSLVVLDPHPTTRKRRYDGKPNEVILEGMTSPVFDYWRPIDIYVSLISGAGFTIDNVLESRNENAEPQMLIISGSKNV